MYVSVVFVLFICSSVNKDSPECRWLQSEVENKTLEECNKSLAHELRVSRTYRYGECRQLTKRTY